jgi:hypothetical protein
LTAEMNTTDPDQLGLPAVNRATLARQLLPRRHPRPGTMSGSRG